MIRTVLWDRPGPVGKETGRKPTLLFIVKVRRLTKNKPYAWWNGPGSKYEPADLDQVVASEQLKFRQIGGADIDVRGWPALDNPSEQASWIKNYSDHGLLYLEVEK